jgi:endoglucanase
MSSGKETILNKLAKSKSKASFFLTGNFLRNPQNTKTIKRIISDDHFLGPHSNKHLLYMPWEKRDSLLVTKTTFKDDLKANYLELKKIGAKDPEKKFYLAPYEWYNSVIASWTGDLGIQLINFTPGSGTNADYTTPDMANYKSSEALISGLKQFEKSKPEGLNGAIILIHLGTDASRTDKLYNRLDEMITYYKSLGYSFNKF